MEIKKLWFDIILKYLNDESFENYEQTPNIYISDFDVFYLKDSIQKNAKSNIIISINALASGYLNYISLNFLYIDDNLDMTQSS